MNEEQLKALDDIKFFELFLGATKEAHKEYCKFKAEEEGLTSYSEPVFQAALEQFNSRLASISK